MKKSLICIILVIVFSLATVGCSSILTSQSFSAPEVSSEDSGLDEGMEFVGFFQGYYENMDTDKFTYYRDIVTDVMYVCFEEYYKAGMTVMLDPENGLPLTYTRYMELIDMAAEED